MTSTWKLRSIHEATGSNGGRSVSRLSFTRRHACRALLLAGVATALTPLADARAEEQAPAPEQQSTNRTAGDTSFTVGSIAVTLERPARVQDVLSSVDILGPDVAQRQNVDSTFKVLGQVAGVLVTDFHQGGTNGSVSFRGFNAEGGISAVKLLIDGIPSNSNDGYMWMLDSVTPMEIGSVEVMRGTSDPRYGLLNIAGNVDVRTRQGGDYIDMRVRAGSWGTYEAQAATGIVTGNFSQNYAFGYRTTEGYRDRGDQRRRNFSGKWFYADDGFSIGAIARYFKASGNDSGFLTQQQAKDDPRQSPAINSTDARFRNGGEYSLHLDAAPTDDLDISLKGYLNNFHDTRFFRIASVASQQERELNEDQKGAIFRLRYRPSIAFLHKLTIEAGADIQSQENHHLRWNASNRSRTSLLFDRDFSLKVYGGYVQAVIEPAAWLKITPAWRLDWVDGRYTNEVSGATYPNNDYGTLSQPKLSAMVTPLKDLGLYANYGRTFQIGLGVASYIVPPQVTNTDPSINEGFEAGVKYGNGWLETRLAVWQQTATGEILMQNLTGDYVNLGSTRRRGFDVQANVRTSDKIDLWASYSYQKGKIVIPDPATPSYKGNTIDHVPAHLFNGGINYRPIEPLRLSATYLAQSKYEIDQSNTHGRYGDRSVIDLEAAWQINPHFEVSGQVKNLTNNQSAYVYYYSNTNQALFSPHDGRAFYVSLRFTS